VCCKYLDSHVFGWSGSGQKEPVGVKLEVLLRIMIRWAVMYHPHLSTTTEVTAQVRKVLCMSTSTLCTPEDFDNFINLPYSDTRREFCHKE
jgi:hypothetical protein